MHNVIDISDQENQEFLPLPEYHWDERPYTVPIDYDEASTAIHLANGDLVKAASLLRVSIMRLSRLVRGSPRLQRILAEAYDVVIIKAISVPISTLFDVNADARRLEWASTKVLATRAAQGHLMSPAPAGNLQTSMPSAGKIVVSWLDEPLASSSSETPVISGDSKLSDDDG